MAVGRPSSGDVQHTFLCRHAFTDHRLNGHSSAGDTGTRTRGREFAVHPDEIKQLHTGWALVACPGSTQPRITRMLHPEDAR